METSAALAPLSVAGGEHNRNARSSLMNIQSSVESITKELQ